MELASVRYIVDDVEQAVSFYRGQLGFELRLHRAPGFAVLERDRLPLLLNAPGHGGAGRAGLGDQRPQPGGWNRFQLTVADLAEVTDRLRAAGVEMRSGIVSGKGGRQALAADPAGNLVELFEPHPQHP